LSNPLNEQVAELLVTIQKLEQQRDKEQEARIFDKILNGENREVTAQRPDRYYHFP